MEQASMGDLREQVRQKRGVSHRAARLLFAGLFDKRRFNGCLLQMVETGLAGDVLRFAMKGETPATRGDVPL
ncbi:hypothetical protein KSC_018190 [Ktedonobacter sp. SOSP1-52]|nr:hypothetical protein KSC_018190 [Ktedonobacter sp. SOSP1-52]